MFNPNRGASARQAMAIAALGIFVWLAVVGSVVYVIAHFVIKYW